jgi:high-affinity iron transporter
VLPTFVIGLREGVEASLIVGIVAAFLGKEGRRDALARMWVGVSAAVALCVAVAVALRLIGEGLPQREQEGLETIVGLIAVGMVTSMVIWMRRNAHRLKAELQQSAASALATGSAFALIGMAFLAVLREGFETAVFLLAVFQDTANPGSAGAGAVLGLIVAIALGWALYRGGVRIDLARFFKLTGLVLVLVAAGLLATSVHTAHEAGWFNGLQAEAFDLSWLVQPGSVVGSLLTGMLGLQPHPTVGETIAWALLALPLGIYVVWPQRRPARPAVARGVATAALGLVAVLVLAGCGGDKGDASSGRSVKVALSDRGCNPSTLQLSSGPTTFQVTGGGSGEVTEFEILDGDKVVAEVENVAPGLTKSLDVKLESGEFQLLCSDDKPRGRLVVKD